MTNINAPLNPEILDWIAKSDGISEETLKNRMLAINENSVGVTFLGNFVANSNHNYELNENRLELIGS